MDVVLAVLGLTSLFVGGQGYRWGWVLGIATQIAWVYYAATTQQYGFLVSACAYAFVYYCNARRLA